MNMRTLSLLLAIAVVPVVKADDKDKSEKKLAKGIIDPKSIDELRGKRHEVVTVEGKFIRVGESKSGTHRYLNFTNNFRDSVSIVFQISKDPEAFAYDKIKAWVGKRVRVTGTVTEYGSDLQILIDSWDQIKEVES